MAVKVSQFVKYLEQIDEQKNAQRFTIFNYFSTYLSPQKELSAQDIEQFYLTALRYEHWQKNVEELSEQFKDLLNRFARKCSLNFEPEDLIHADKWQLITIDNQTDQNQCLDRFLHRHYGQCQDITYKVMALAPDRQACLLRGKERLRVNVFSNTWYLRQGDLCPMNPVTQLTYNMNLDFIENTGQFIEMNPHTQFYFNSHQIYYGCYLRGYSMQKTHPNQFRNFSDVPEVYRCLKQLEAHYINTSSDPEYQNLIRLLDKANQMLANSTPGGVPFGEKALKQGHFALKNIFPNDKYLRLLLSQLELSMVKVNTTEEKTWQWQDLKNHNLSASTNS